MQIKQIRRLLKTFFIPSFLMGIGQCQPASPEHSTTENTTTLPNIVYILVDDLGYGDLSSYGQETLSTPHIDRLAKQGMRFTQHYAGNTVCAPSRASLLTGKHPGHVSVRGNQPAGQLLRPEETTLAEVVAEAGYASLMVGKWGVGHPPAPDDPLKHGFDHAYGYINMWHAHNFYPEFLYEDAQKVALPGNVLDTSYDYPPDMMEGTGVAREKAIYAPDNFRQEALAFITQHQDQPFFLYLALNMPHANNEAGWFTGDGMEVPTYGQYADQDWPQPEKGFAAMITYMDNMVGRVVTHLDTLGLAENTLLIFTSDNGPHQEGGHSMDYFDSNGSLRGGKRDLYEGGIRVPMIARWPGKIPADVTTDHVSAFWDVLPTVADIVGVEPPPDIDGISFLPTLLQTGNQPQHAFLYWEFYEDGGKQAVREGTWKGIKLNVSREEAPVFELYQLDQDPDESDDVAEQHPGVVKRLEAHMQSAHEPFEHLPLYYEDISEKTP